jgi:osmotically-inducible protein OsmY
LATSANAARQARFDDSQITRAITTNLAVDARISPHLVDVATKDGIVTLSGTVSHLLEKELTLQVVERIRGVRGVIDNLNVRPVARSDEQIERDVADALAENPTTEAYEVLVHSDRGMVTLTGDVDSWAEKLMAANVAKRVKGIKAVDNNIEVSLDYDRTDAEIEADVRARWRIDPYTEEELRDSRVNDRTV